MSQLKNDGTPEFVLDGTYYTLPLEASKLVQAGWSLETEEYEAAEVMLQPGNGFMGSLPGTNRNWMRRSSMTVRNHAARLREEP